VKNVSPIGKTFVSVALTSLATIPRGRLPMMNTKVLTSIVAALATTITMQSFAQGRLTGATPAAGAQVGATPSAFTTSDAIPWKPMDPKHPGLQMFAVWGNPNEGASEILQKVHSGLREPRWS